MTVSRRQALERARSRQGQAQPTAASSRQGTKTRPQVARAATTGTGASAGLIDQSRQVGGDLRGERPPRRGTVREQQRDSRHSSRRRAGRPATGRRSRRRRPTAPASRPRSRRLRDRSRPIDDRLEPAACRLPGHPESVTDARPGESGPSSSCDRASLSRVSVENVPGCQPDSSPGIAGRAFPARDRDRLSGQVDPRGPAAPRIHAENNTCCAENAVTCGNVGRKHVPPLPK